MRSFRIDYPNGHMELAVDRFFPCSRADAVKIFKLINRYCGREERLCLYDYLADMDVDFLIDGKEVMRKRTLMNLRLLEVG